MWETGMCSSMVGSGFARICSSLSNYATPSLTKKKTVYNLTPRTSTTLKPKLPESSQFKLSASLPTTLSARFVTH